MAHNTNTKVTKNKDLSQLEMADTFRRIYNMIATWNNEDGTSPGLKLATQGVIDEVLKKVFAHFGLGYRVGIPMEEDLKEKVQKMKSDDPNFVTVVPTSPFEPADLGEITPEDIDAIMKSRKEKGQEK